MGEKMSAIKQKEKNVAVLRVRNSRLKSKSFNSACILLLGTVTQSLASAPMKSTVNENDIRESTHQIVRINISECVRQSFTYLMPDRHLEKYMMNDFNFRRRSYGTGKFKNKSFSWDSE